MTSFHSKQLFIGGVNGVISNSSFPLAETLNFRIASDENKNKDGRSLFISNRTNFVSVSV